MYRRREKDGAQVPLQAVKGLMVQAKEFEHYLGNLKGTLKGITWGLPLWEPDPEPRWRHEFLVTESQQNVNSESSLVADEEKPISFPYECLLTFRVES